MKHAILTLSRNGLAVARRIRDEFPDSDLHIHESIAPTDGGHVFQRVSERMRELFDPMDGIICIMPCGVIARAIAPLVKSKLSDPAIVAVDVGGRWAVSFLSGHEGGANDLALDVANVLDAEPVITTTTEAEKNLVAGIGCRRGISSDAVEAALLDGLSQIDRSLEEVRLLASAELKRDESGLIQAARNMHVPIRWIPHDSIRECTREFQTTRAAEKHLELPAVAEPAALLVGRRTRLLLPKIALSGVTIAIAEERCPW